MADERDPRVTQRYRELDGEEPSRELDQAILAAAHRAADRPHAPLVTPAGRHRWYFSLAAVAVLVLAVAITLHVEQRPPETSEAVAVPAAPAPAANEEAGAKKKLQVEAPQKPAQAPARQDASIQRAPRSEPPANVANDVAVLDERRQPQSALMKEQRRDEERAAAERKAEGARRPAAAAVPEARPAAPAAERRLASRATTPEAELERIAELRRLGRDEDADKALAEFRKRYPGYQISAETRAKVEKSEPARAR